MLSHPASYPNSYFLFLLLLLLVKQREPRHDLLRAREFPLQHAPVRRAPHADRARERPRPDVEALGVGEDVVLCRRACAFGGVVVVVVEGQDVVCPQQLCERNEQRVLRQVRARADASAPSESTGADGMRLVGWLVGESASVGGSCGYRGRNLGVGELGSHLRAMAQLAGMGLLPLFDRRAVAVFLRQIRQRRRLGVQEAQRVEVVRVRVVALVEVDGPRVAQHVRPRGQVAPAVRVGFGGGVRRPAQHGDGPPAQHLLAERAHVGQGRFVVEGRGAGGADDGV